METATDNNNKATMRRKKNRDINAPSGEIRTFPLGQFAKFKNTCEKGGKGWKIWTISYSYYVGVMSFTLSFAQGFNHFNAYKNYCTNKFDNGVVLIMFWNKFIIVS